MKKSFKKVISLGLVSSLMLLMLAGCGKKVEEGVFVIGGSGPLTGGAASYGISVK